MGFGIALVGKKTFSARSSVSLWRRFHFPHNDLASGLR